ncbi:hypothetical protein T06_15068 [Trichinella sp. T6]|nr:hypothetical protein T06_15068 [Trichinella sp. T6]
MGNISIHDIENAIHDVILDSNPNTLTTREVRIQLEKQFDENLHDKRVIIDEITMRMLVKKLKPIEELDVINEQKGIGLKNASTSESSDSSDDESSVVQCFNEDDYSDDSSDISIFDIFSEDEKEGNDAVPSSSNSNLSPPEQKNSELEDEMLARRLHLEELGCRQRSTKYYSHIKRCLVRSRDQALSSAKEKKTPTTIASESFLSPALTNLLGAQKDFLSEINLISLTFFTQMQVMHAVETLVLIVPKERRSETLVDKLHVFDKVMDDDIQKIPGKVEVFKGKSNAQLIGMNIESAVCFKYAPVTLAEMRRSELVRRMWEIIKERNLLENFESMNLQDPTNRAFVICDTQFEDIFKCKRFKAFTMMKYLKFHVSDVSPFEN